MAQSLDPREMGVLHSVYRREFRLAPGLVRGVPDGDTQRAAIVFEHLDLIEHALDEHHDAEDEVLWPLLLERVPEDLAPVVRRMAAQHERVKAALSQIEVQRRQWVRAAEARLGIDLAQHYENLYPTLLEHLDDEERNAMPLVAQHLTPAEWRRRARHSSGDKSIHIVTLMYGMMRYDGDSEVIANMVPLPARMLLDRLGMRAFRKHSLVVHGTPTP